MLQLHEIEKIKADPDCIRRFLRSYDMQLNFYGVKVVDPTTGLLSASFLKLHIFISYFSLVYFYLVGKLGRTAEWKLRYRNLETHYHNYLRITRILKCLGELGFEHYKVILRLLFQISCLLSSYFVMLLFWIFLHVETVPRALY